jgi:hypothetical protein
MQSIYALEQGQTKDGQPLKKRQKIGKKHTTVQDHKSVAKCINKLPRPNTKAFVVPADHPKAWIKLPNMAWLLINPSCGNSIPS